MIKAQTNNGAGPEILEAGMDMEENANAYSPRFIGEYLPLEGFCIWIALKWRCIWSQQVRTGTWAGHFDFMQYVRYKSAFQESVTSL
jgi:hypothetical protein